MALRLGCFTNRIINPANLFSLAVALAISLLGLGTSSYAHSFAHFEARPTQQININCRNNNIVLPSPISIEHQLKGGECEAYSLVLTSGQYVHVVVDQRGIDVALTFRGPGGEE